jgi:hypothetical protein
MHMFALQLWSYTALWTGPSTLHILYTLYLYGAGRGNSRDTLPVRKVTNWAHMVYTCRPLVSILSRDDADYVIDHVANVSIQTRRSCAHVLAIEITVLDNAFIKDHNPPDLHHCCKHDMVSPLGKDFGSPANVATP